MRAWLIAGKGRPAMAQDCAQKVSLWCGLACVVKFWQLGGWEAGGASHKVGAPPLPLGGGPRNGGTCYGGGVPEKVWEEGPPVWKGPLWNGPCWHTQHRPFSASDARRSSGSGPRQCESALMCK